MNFRAVTIIERSFQSLRTFVCVVLNVRWNENEGSFSFLSLRRKGVLEFSIALISFTPILRRNLFRGYLLTGESGFKIICGFECLRI